MRLLKPLLPPLCKHGAARPTWQRRWLPPTLQTRHSAADVRSNAQKLVNALWADRVSQLKAACNTLNIIKHCIRHVVIDLWCMLSYVWVADGRILSLKQSLLEINQLFHNDWLLSRHEEHIQCRWCSWENDWARQIHSPPRYTGACGKCLGCHTKTRDILCLISHCGCQFPLPGCRQLADMFPMSSLLSRFLKLYVLMAFKSMGSRSSCQRCLKSIWPTFGTLLGFSLTWTTRRSRYTQQVPFTISSPYQLLGNDNDRMTM